MDKAKFAAIGAAVAQFGMLRYFPLDEEAKRAVMHLLDAMTSNADQVRWLAGTVVAHYNEWPGPLEIRAVYCTRYKPRDGAEATLGSSSPLGRAMEARQQTQADDPRLLSARLREIAGGA